MKCIDEEIPFEIPLSWCWVRLVSIGNTETGTTPSKTHPEYFGDYMPFIGPGNIQNNRIMSYTQGISEVGVDYCRPVPKNTILQVCIGGSIGKAAITTEQSAFNQQINSIETYKCVDYKYVYYTLLTDYFKKAMLERSTGTATPIINRSNWEGIILPIPPQYEQQRIVSRIEELMHVANKYEKSQEALDRLNTEIYDKLKKSVLQEAIQGKLVSQDPNDEPASVLLERIKEEKAKLFKEGKLKKKELVDSVIFKGEDNKYYERQGKTLVEIEDHIPFRIPDTWEWTTLDCVSYSVGSRNNQIQSKEILKDGQYPVVSQGLSLIDGYTNEDSKVIRDLPVVLFGDHTRNVKYIDFPFVIGADGTKLHKAIIIYPQFLFLWMQYAANSLRDRGYARHYSLLRETYFPLPPYKEQLRIVDKYNTVLTSIMSR